MSTPPTNDEIDASELTLAAKLLSECSGEDYHSRESALTLYAKLMEARSSRLAGQLYQPSIPADFYQSWYDKGEGYTIRFDDIHDPDALTDEQRTEQRLAALEAVVFAKESAPMSKETIDAWRTRVADSVEKFAEASAPHNPHNIPPDKIPAGYRLARVGEMDGEKHEGSKFFNIGKGEFTHDHSGPTSCVHTSTGDYTIIVPITPKAEGEVDWFKITKAAIEATDDDDYDEYGACGQDAKEKMARGAVAEYLRQKGQQP